MALDVVLCSDRNSLRGLAVSVRSALEASSTTLNIHVLGTGLTAQDKADLEASWRHQACGKVVFGEVPLTKLARFRSTRYLKSKASYSRYFINDILPASSSRCLYLDADLVVFKDVAEAETCDMQGKGIGAVRDISIRSRGVWPELRQRLGLKSEHDYFNTGVLVIDMDAWRSNEVERRLVDVSIAKFDQLDSQDQDALNILFEDDVKLLDVSWNFSQYERRDPVGDGIIHMLGRVKPWHARYLRQNGDDAYLLKNVYGPFYAFLDRTAYAGWRPWNGLGLGPVIEDVLSNIPTRDMVVGKLRRFVNRRGAPEAA